MIKNAYQSFRKFHAGPLGFFVDAALFVIITYGFHLLFRHFSSEIMAVPFVKASSLWLTEMVYQISLWINRHVLGLQITTEPVRTMWFSNGGHVQVSESCSGLKLFYQVTVLFIIFPGPWKHKLWFIPLGIIAMFLTNIFRIVSLSLILLWKPEFWDFSHDWILRPLFYIIIFMLWIWWVESFRNPQKTKIRTE